jgi:hypothetical protein
MSAAQPVQKDVQILSPAEIKQVDAVWEAATRQKVQKQDPSCVSLSSLLPCFLPGVHAENSGPGFLDRDSWQAEWEEGGKETVSRPPP